MSDKETVHTPEQHVYTVKADEFAQFLVEKTPESNCPACGHNHWTVICPPPGEQNAYRMRIQLADGPRSGSMSLLGIYCDNCGYVRTHMARVVRKWIDARQLDLDLGEDESEVEVNE